VIVEDATYDVMAASDALICTSGTATLEAAILKKPMVIVYKLGPENALEIKLVRKKVPIVGMPNLLAEKIICPEFVQENCLPETISQEIIGLLLEPERLFQQKTDLARAVALLGEPGGAARAAQMVLEFLA
jgi:lipid-A-disaccharide synthase